MILRLPSTSRQNASSNTKAHADKALGLHELMADFPHIPPSLLGEPCDQCREIVRCGTDVASYHPSYSGHYPVQRAAFYASARTRPIHIQRFRKVSSQSTIEMTAAISRSRPEGAFKVPLWVAPDIPSLLQVNRGEVPFGSSASSKISLPVGALFARITSATYTPHQTYSSIQIGRDVNLELNSDLVFINHGCNPSLEFDMARFEIRVVKDRPLHEGDELSFFYPSTEWRMAQPFDCRCDAPKGICLKSIEGAENLSDAVLGRYWLNKHIEELLADRSMGKC